MKTYRYHTVDVFTSRPFAGNPLAVVPDARGLDGEQMQMLAREFNYSESAFVLPNAESEETFRVRIFTPTEELPFAGHPTIGTAFILAATGAMALDREIMEVTFLEGAGRVPVRVEAAQGRPLRAELTAPQPFSSRPAEVDPGDLAAAIGLEENDLMGTEEPPLVIGCGLPFLLVPLRGLEAARRAVLHLEVWERRVGIRTTAGIYLMAREVEGNADVHVRLFAPDVGVSEDPATGSAATALAGYLAQREHRVNGNLSWTIEQGLEIGRPSRLEISSDKKDGSILALRCAGACVRVFDGTFEI